MVGVGLIENPSPAPKAGARPSSYTPMVGEVRFALTHFLFPKQEPF